MRLHRTLIATAVTLGTVAGALAFSGAGQSTAAAESSAAIAAATPPPASREAAPPLRPAAPVVMPAVSATPASTRMPDGAAPLDVDLSPVGSDAPIATGAEAARWLNEAPPRVRRDVADNVGRAPEELTRLFLDDPTAFLAADGMVGYIDPAPPEGIDHTDHDHDRAADEPSGAADAATASTLVEALGTTPDDVFALHSLRSSTKAIYLDFDGHQMQNEYWNSRFSIGPFTNDPYDID
ncbi:MAG: hypothetical protein LH616_03935, partial [Ilumatobacteraceae bacterium]|nr:hypothetical protein [Ilumatobacteraceae bacterium]